MFSQHISVILIAYFKPKKISKRKHVLFCTYLALKAYISLIGKVERQCLEQHCNWEEGIKETSVEILAVAAWTISASRIYLVYAGLSFMYKKQEKWNKKTQWRCNW